jgi:hypothetical protein
VEQEKLSERLLPGSIKEKVLLRAIFLLPKVLKEKEN